MDENSRPTPTDSSAPQADGSAAQRQVPQRPTLIEGTDDPWAEEATATLQIDRPREVLAWLPYQLHFWPHESVVLASIRCGPTPEHSHEPGHELGLVARTDLSIIGNPIGGRQAQVEMSRHLQRDGADRVICALYTDQPFAAVLRGEGPAGRTLTWWRSTPWAELGHTYLVGPERFRCLDCAVEPCCPHTGQPLEVLANTEIAAWYVYHGHRYADRREALVSDAQAPDEARTAAAAAAEEHLALRPMHAGADLSAWQRQMVQRWVQLVHSGACAAPGQRPSPEELGLLLAGLADPWVRDAALLWAGSGHVLGGRDLVEELDASEVIDAVFSGRMRPHASRVRAADQALGLLSAYAGQAWCAPVLTCRAWLSWWTGDGARANILLTRALEADPEYSLARLLGTALVHGIPPGWARAAPHAS